MLGRRERSGSPAARASGRFVALAVVVAAATGCTSTRREVPVVASVVDVGMNEYAFTFDATGIRAGRVVFRARNLGHLDHEMLLVELPDDFPPIGEQLQGDERRPVSNVGRVAARKPGTTGTFAADLAAGRYGLICFVRDADGNQHAVKGMAQEFRVR